MKMEKELYWFNVDSVPEDYIFPDENRPQNLQAPLCDSIPVIDLGKPTAVAEIMAAAQEFGFFQVINHGVPEDTIMEAKRVSEEFFKMPSKDACGGIYEGNLDLPKNGVYLWRENLKLPCYPLQESISSWPREPYEYRKIMAAYLIEIQKLSLKILDMISRGLGLDPGYFDHISQLQLLSTNFYPPCPDPSLTMGILGHKDPSFITLLFQGDVPGLQVKKDGEWINVGTVPNAFVVNIGDQLEVISNGKLNSIEHRVVTNANETRLSIATFVNPTQECVVEPAKALVNEFEEPRYKARMYKEYAEENKVFGDYTIAIQKATRADARAS